MPSMRELVNDRPTMLGIITYLMMTTWLTSTWPWWASLMVASAVFVFTGFVERYFSTRHPNIFFVHELSPQTRPLLVEVSRSLPIPSDFFLDSDGNDDGLSVSCTKATARVISAWFADKGHHHVSLQLFVLPREGRESSEWLHLLTSWVRHQFVKTFKSNHWLILGCQFKKQHDLVIDSHEDVRDKMDSAGVIIAVNMLMITELSLDGVKSRDEGTQCLEEHVINHLVPQLGTILYTLAKRSENDHSDNASLSSHRERILTLDHEEEGTSSESEVDVDVMISSVPSREEETPKERVEAFARPEQPMDEEQSDCQHDTSPEVNESTSLTETDPVVQEVQSYIKEAMSIINEVERQATTRTST